MGKGLMKQAISSTNWNIKGIVDRNKWAVSKYEDMTDQRSYTLNS